MIRLLPYFTATAFVLFATLSVGSDDNNFSKDKHTKNFGIECSGCHKETPPSKKVGSGVCVECHGSIKDVGKNTVLKDLPNPHINHNEELYCEDCHHSHRPPENFCSQCHDFAYIIP